MRDIITRLNNKDEHVSNLELLDEVIAFQFSKILKYHEKNSLKISNTISEKAENSMNNLIELLKLRENYKYEQ